MSKNIMVKIEIIDGPLMQRMGMISQDIMEKTAIGVQAAALEVATAWKGFAYGERLPNGEMLIPPNVQFAESIEVHKQTQFHWIVSSNHKDARLIEDGKPEVDMKDTGGPWLMSRKTRVSKDGTPYLVIPFGHGTPKAIHNPMPRMVYEEVKRLIKRKLFNKSTVLSESWQNVGIKEEANVHGEMMPRASYNWGSSLVNVEEAFPEIRNPAYLNGMYAFEKSSGKQNYSSYVTFRTLSAKSPEGSWIQKGKPAYHMAQAAAEKVKELIRDQIQAALDADLGRLS